MSNESQVLRQGYGMPLIWLSNNKDQPIRFIDDTYGLNTDRSINEFITKFKYVYDEENDDECIIALGFQSIAQANAASLPEDTILMVRWGYVIPGGEVIQSPPRIVAIRNIDIDQTDDKIQVEWNCTDLASYLRNTKTSALTDKKYFEDWLKEVVGGKFIPTITTERTLTVLTKGKETNKVIDLNTSTIREEPITDKTTIVGVEHGKTVKVGWSMSIRAAVEARLNEAKEGPYQLDGRDDTLNVILRNFKQEPFASWTYAAEPGELMDFRSKTNLKALKLGEHETTTVDPITKEVKTISTEYIQSENEDLTQSEMAVAYEKTKAAWDHNVNYEHDQVSPKDITVKRQQTQVGFEKPEFQRRDGTDLLQRPLTYNRRFDIPIKNLIKTPGFQMEHAKGVVDNEMMRKLEKSYTATAKVIGDPTLVTSKTYMFNNLVAYNEGKWYAVRIEHEIEIKSGYVSTLHLIKMPKKLGLISESSKKKYVNTVEEYEAETGEEMKYKEENEQDKKETPEEINLRVHKEKMRLRKNKTNFDAIDQMRARKNMLDGERNNLMNAADYKLEPTNKSQLNSYISKMASDDSR